MHDWQSFVGFTKPVARQTPPMRQPVVTGAVHMLPVEQSAPPDPQVHTSVVQVSPSSAQDRRVMQVAFVPLHD